MTAAERQISLYYQQLYLLRFFYILRLYQIHKALELRSSLKKEAGTDTGLFSEIAPTEKDPTGHMSQGDAENTVGNIWRAIFGPDSKPEVEPEKKEPAKFTVEEGIQKLGKYRDARYQELKSPFSPKPTYNATDTSVGSMRNVVDSVVGAKGDLPKTKRISDDPLKMQEGPDREKHSPLQNSQGNMRTNAVAGGLGMANSLAGDLGKNKLRLETWESSSGSKSWKLTIWDDGKRDAEGNQYYRPRVVESAEEATAILKRHRDGENLINEGLGKQGVFK